jgi:hypothetical protein
MIRDEDKVLRQLLVREMPIQNGEIKIEFEQPKREWSTRLNRPTLNIFLHDLRENNTLRQAEWEIKRNGDGSVSRQRMPIRLDLYYIITAWAAHPEDEHLLLSRALTVLFLHPFLPEDLLPDSLRGQPKPVQLRTAQRDAQYNPADLWGVLDNELRPAIDCLVTVALNPYQEFPLPLVRTRDLRVRQAAGGDLPSLDSAVGPDQFWTVGGMLHDQRGERPLEIIRLRLVERDLDIPIQAGGRYVIGNLEAGDYTLEVAAAGGRPSQHKITVPSENYDVEI